MSSTLSSQIKRLGALLRRGAEDQVEETRGRLESTVEAFKDFVSKVIVSNFDHDRALETAERMFGTTKAKFAAVDGSEDQKLVSGLAVFWGGAYAATGTIEFRKGQTPKVEYATGFIERGKGVSSCIPVYVDRVSEVDQAVMTEQDRGQTTVSKAMTEQAVVDNSTIASWIMTFSEYYLAYQIAKNKEADIILLDRSLSTTLNSLTYDTSRRSRWVTEGSIHGYEVNGVPIDKNDMGYGRHHIVNPGLALPTARGDYIRYALVLHVQQAGKPLGVDEICRGLGIKTDDRRKRALNFLEKSVHEGYLIESGEKYAPNPLYLRSWQRVTKLMEDIGGQFFEGVSANPMRIKKKDGDHWITTQDLAFLTLYCIEMLIEECWSNNVLLIGITKDTTARDFKGHLAPVCGNEGIWNVDGEKLRQVPSTDRMLLQATSVYHHKHIPVPWSLVEYDTAFQTIVPDFKHRKGFVAGGRRNRISRERLFVKSYIQLDQSKRDPQFRSNVLFIDRLAYPRYDGENIIHFSHQYGGAVEPMDVILYRDKTVPNELQNLVMVVLSAMTAKSIPEVFGHNKPLFIADKIAKAQRARAKGMVDGTGQWLTANPGLRKFCFYMNTFRERRSEVEYARRRR